MSEQKYVRDLNVEPYLSRLSMCHKGSGAFEEICEQHGLDVSDGGEFADAATFWYEYSADGDLLELWVNGYSVPWLHHRVWQVYPVNEFVIVV